MNRVYLIGLPGAGKTHCGKWLAGQLRWEFLDLDSMIEKHTGKTIPEIFESAGEEAFRKIESDVLRKTSELKNVVVSCGGGTPAFNDNMDWMLRNGLTVFLNTPLDKIVTRLSRNYELRPLFSGVKKPQLRSKLSELSEKRGEYYSRAKLIWNKEQPDASLYDAVNQLLALYSARF